MADLVIFVCWFLSIVTIINAAPRVRGGLTLTHYQLLKFCSLTPSVFFPCRERGAKRVNLIRSPT